MQRDKLSHAIYHLRAPWRPSCFWVLRRTEYSLGDHKVAFSSASLPWLLRRPWHHAFYTCRRLRDTVHLGSNIQHQTKPSLFCWWRVGQPSNLRYQWWHSTNWAEKTCWLANNRDSVLVPFWLHLDNITFGLQWAKLTCFSHSNRLFSNTPLMGNYEWRRLPWWISPFRSLIL